MRKGVLMVVCWYDESTSNGYDIRANKFLGTFYAKSRYLTYVERKMSSVNTSLKSRDQSFFSRVHVTQITSSRECIP